MEQQPDVTIIIPSMDNQRYLAPCLSSIIQNTTNVSYRVLVINNGHPDSCGWVWSRQCMVLQAGRNLGWEGGLQLGLTLSASPYVLFLNDDTLILPSQRAWLSRLMEHFDDPQVAAAGPSSNVVAGSQATQWQTPSKVLPVRFLIGFCLLVRRDVLDDVGGIDLGLPGGDDIDLSIRIRRAGFSLVCDRRVFVYHYGFRTGTRLHGSSNEPGGWNSREYTDRVTAALVAKHGRHAVNETWGTIVA